MPQSTPHHDADPAPEHAPRPRFDTLFADPRHYRGDVRLFRTAIRRGWLNDAPQADRDALVARFEQASRERDAAGYVSDGQRVRTTFAEVWAWIELERANLDPEIRAWRYWWAGRFADRDVSRGGRPRVRWYASDFPNRIDAHELRRRALADGTDLSRLYAIDVRPADKPDAEPERIALAVVADARYGWRVWLVCPGCQRRRRYLFPTRDGARCRGCAGIGYAQPSR